MANRKQLLEKILGKIKPGKNTVNSEKKLAEKIIAKIMKTKGKHTKAELVGSLSRNTHLKGNRDLDIFVFYHKELPRKEFENEGLKIGKSVFRGHKWEKAYSEHPYIRGTINGFDVEIVPAYEIESPEELKSAVDRSYFHSEYVKGKLGKNQEDEIRLLKQFMIGIKCYGADLSTSSFPGYVAELLILKYGTFTKCIEGVSKWKNGETVDLEGYYNGKEAAKKFDSHLIIVDPVDKNRNVAAAISKNQYTRFIAAARAFSKNPSENFFFPKPHKAWSEKKLKEFLEKTELIAVKLGYPKGALEDILWGQVRKLSRKLSTMAEGQGFVVKRKEEWIQAEKQLVIILEVESLIIQKAKIITGPEITDSENCIAFLEAHKKPLSGPRIENGRLVLEVERSHTDLEKYIADSLKKLKKQEKNPLRKALNKKTRIMEENEILIEYKKNASFRQFLTGYLKGKEEFLDY